MLRIAPLLAGLLLVTACGKEKKKDDPAAGATPTPAPDETGTTLRKIAKDSYTSVGMVTVSNKLRCSGLILKHGVFATAKHCFWSDNPNKSTLGLIFTGPSGIIGDDSIKIPSSAVKELNLDGDGNDIAYVIYDASKTKGKVELTTINIIKEPPEPDTPMSLVGFPSSIDSKLRKLATAPCKRLDKQGTIEPNATDEKGYDGELYDTDCGAWFGNSGGPLFVMDADDTTKVLGSVGVVTHTFDIDTSGEIPDSALGKDSFGTYVKTVNFSCYKDAKSLDENLSKGED